MTGALTPARLKTFGAYLGARDIAALRRYRSGLGDTSQTGQLVGKGVSLAAGAGASALIGTAAGTAGAIAFGAAAGSVVPIIGTVIGAAIGFLTTKLFGHANYAQVYSDVSNTVQLFEAYETVAGQYPGRVYGWPEIRFVFLGAMLYGIFPGNGPPTPGSCTQALISRNINACGTTAWIDDWIGAGAPNPAAPGTLNIAQLVGKALANGVTNPVQIAQQYLVPGAEALSQTKGNASLSVTHSRDPALYTQMLIDIADVMVSTKNPNTPIYYGVIPQGSAGAASATTATPTQSAAPQVPVQSTAVYGQSTSGTSIKGGSAGTLTNPQGTWTFGPNTSSSGYQVLVNGLPAGNAYGVLLSVQPNGSLLLTDASNNTYQWSGVAWSSVSTASPAAAISNPASAPALSAAGSKITPSSGGSLVSAAGTWTFGSSNDGNGNYQILLNGAASAAGNSNATQLQINSSGVVVATVSNGSTYSWGSGGWNTLSGPVTSVAVSTPTSVSQNGASIVPGGGSQLITAQGEWTFSTSNDGTGNYYVMLNGSLAGSETGVQLTILNGIPTLLRNDGSTWSWGGTGWTQLTSANTTPVTTDTTAPSLMGSAPVGGSDAASYDGGPYPDGYGSSSYSPGYGGYSATAPTPAVPVASGMSTKEKVFLIGGGVLLLLAGGFALTGHHRR